MTEPSSPESTVQRLLALIEALEPDDRLELFSELRVKLCLFCGKTIKACAEEHQ